MSRSRPSSRIEAPPSSAPRTATLRGRFLLLPSLVLLAACGAGTAGIVASADDDGGGGNAPTGISAFRIESSKTPPARIRFVLADPEANPVEVELLATVDDPVHGERTEPLARIDDPAFPANPTTLPTSRDGIAYELEWNFPAEALLPDDARFTPDVTVFAQLDGAAQELVDGGNSAAVGMGNDPPVIALEDPPAEVDGVVPIQLQLSDSSGDAVSIRVEFDVEGDELGWQRARPGGLDAKDPTPDPALSGIVAPADPGTELVFFWDTDSDLAELERDVRVRFTPIDPVVAGATKETSSFRVDNNAAPIVQLQNDAVIANPDERRGIPIPFRVIDEEEDLVEVIFQWRREGEEFPELPRDDAALDAILADPEQRREHHVCTPYPRYAKGRVIPIDATSVRLPELAAGESWILASGLEGKTLELLRPSSIPEPITPTWATNPLVSPVAALPVGDGLTALVLDVPGNGRLREIELATGAVVREIATFGQGIPSAMGPSSAARTPCSSRWTTPAPGASSASSSRAARSPSSSPPTAPSRLPCAGSRAWGRTRSSSRQALRSFTSTTANRSRTSGRCVWRSCVGWPPMSCGRLVAHVLSSAGCSPALLRRGASSSIRWPRTRSTSPSAMRIGSCPSSLTRTGASPSLSPRRASWRSRARARSRSRTRARGSSS
jgi:hypothetical protein